MIRKTHKEGIKPVKLTVERNIRTVMPVAYLPKSIDGRRMHTHVFEYIAGYQQGIDFVYLYRYYKALERQLTEKRCFSDIEIQQAVQYVVGDILFLDIVGNPDADNKVHRFVIFSLYMLHCEICGLPRVRFFRKYKIAEGRWTRALFEQAPNEIRNHIQHRRAYRRILQFLILTASKKIFTSLGYKFEAAPKTMVEDFSGEVVKVMEEATIGDMVFRRHGKIIKF